MCTAGAQTVEVRIIVGLEDCLPRLAAIGALHYSPLHSGKHDARVQRIYSETIVRIVTSHVDPDFVPRLTKVLGMQKKGLEIPVFAPGPHGTETARIQHDEMRAGSAELPTTPNDTPV